MPSWEDARAHLLERFAISVDAGDWLALSWQFPGPAGDVEQVQRIERAESAGRELLIALCPVIAAGQVAPDEALAHNMTLATGALARAGSTLVLRAAFDLEHLPHTQLDRALELTAHEAARLRALLSGGVAVGSAAAFDHWT